MRGSLLRALEKDCIASVEIGKESLCSFSCLCAGRIWGAGIPCGFKQSPAKDDGPERCVESAANIAALLWFL